MMNFKATSEEQVTSFPLVWNSYQGVHMCMWHNRQFHTCILPLHRIKENISNRWECFFTMAVTRIQLSCVCITIPIYKWGISILSTSVGSEGNRGNRDQFHILHISYFPCGRIYFIIIKGPKMVCLASFWSFSIFECFLVDLVCKVATFVVWNYHIPEIPEQLYRTSHGMILNLSTN